MRGVDGMDTYYIQTYHRSKIKIMLYQLSLLPFFALASSANVKHIDDATKAKVLDLTRAKLAVPRSFGARVAKYHSGGQTSLLKGASVEVPEDIQHLRSLKMKDNFVAYAQYNDAACTQQVLTFGSLVNYW